MTIADTWLTGYLNDHGPVLSKVVKAAGAEAGYTARTLQRAMTSIAGRTTGRGPATLWELSVTSARPQSRQDQDNGPTTSTDGPAPTGPTCPTCGHRWPVIRFEPPMKWWCPFDGTRYAG